MKNNSSLLYNDFTQKGEIVVIINKAYKFRMYPNENQKELIHKTIGCTRFLYNYMLNKKKENMYLSNFDLIKQIPSLIVTYLFLK